MWVYTKAFFNLILYAPLVYGLVFLYNTAAFHDLGIAIVLLTIIIRLVLYPLFYKSFLNQTLLQKLQPAINRIQNDHKHDKEKQAQAMMALYKEHKVNPFTGFLLLFIQLPILIILYQIFLHPPAELSSISLGLLDLSKSSIIIVGLATIAQYVQTKLTLPKIKPGEEVSPATKVAKQMAIIGPALTLLILWKLPAAIGLYWLITSLFSLLQQIYINKKFPKYMEMLKQTIQQLLAGMGFEDFSIETDAENKKVSIIINEGEWFKSWLPRLVSEFNYLINLIHKKNEESSVFVDINNYRKEREHLIVELAKAAARKALMTKVEIKLPAMNAYERRLIHVELATRPDIKTESIGAGSERGVVVKPI